MKVWHLVGPRPIGPTYEIRYYNPEPELNGQLTDDGFEWEETTLDEVLDRFKKHCLYERERNGLDLRLTVKAKEEKIRYKPRLVKVNK